MPRIIFAPLHLETIKFILFRTLEFTRWQENKTIKLGQICPSRRKGLKIKRGRICPSKKYMYSSKWLSVHGYDSMPISNVKKCIGILMSLFSVYCWQFSCTWISSYIRKHIFLLYQGFVCMSVCSHKFPWNFSIFNPA